MERRGGVAAESGLACAGLQNDFCNTICHQRTRPKIGMGDFFVRDPAAVRLAPCFVNVKSCTEEVGDPARARPIRLSR